MVSEKHPSYAADHQFRVLTWQQWRSWRENGFLVVPDVVPVALCDAVVELLWSFLDADPTDPTTWYELPAHHNEAPTRRAAAGMLEIYHDRAMWEIRQHPRLYDTFVDLWGTEALWVTIDRANLNVPVTDDWAFDGFLHWDIEPSTVPAPSTIQGIVSLTDTSANMGGLQVVPEAFRRYDELAARQVGSERPRFPEVEGMEVVGVESKAGDLVVWEGRTVHGTGRNTSDVPRFAQYVSAEPAQPDDIEQLELRLRSFRERSAYLGNSSFRGDPRELEVGEPPLLTTLGERLLGLANW